MRCYRIRFSDLAVCEIKGEKCRKSRMKFPDVMKVVGLFEKCGNLELIRDGEFLIGGFCDGKITGGRIDVLPDGVRLNKGFSLFAPRLTIHDEKSHGHWDVIFKNPSGSFSYLYSLDKVRISKDKKFGLVDDFERHLPELKRNLMNALKSGRVAGGEYRDDDLVLAMLVLLKTKMRVGGEIYYRRSRHKGLTTLKKKDLSIAGNRVTFDFIGKDGVPQSLSEVFSDKVLDELKRVLKKKRQDDFIFLNSNGKIFRDVEFEAGFERFCGERFYPHIVRSHFATRETEKFLRKVAGDRLRVASDARKFCLKVASKLGHKKWR